jgi:hypothetical protein
MCDDRDVQGSSKNKPELLTMREHIRSFSKPFNPCVMIGGPPTPSIPRLSCALRSEIIICVSFGMCSEVK